MDSTMRSIHKYGLAVINDRTLLIVREHETTAFLIPGGRPDAGETPFQTLEREIREELNCGLTSSTLQLLGDYTDVAANQPNATITVSLYLGSLIGNPEPSAEIEEIRWFNRKQDDAGILAPSIRNKILPDLIARGLL
jgi:8-oxo-dGTP diphosphatase